MAKTKVKPPKGYTPADLTREVMHRQPQTQQIAMWICEAADYAEIVARGVKVDASEGHAVRAMFWVRLYGVVTNARSWFVERAGHVTHENIKVIVDAIDTVLGALSDEERAYVEYRRTRESHPVLDGYSPLTRRSSRMLKNQTLEQCAELAGAPFEEIRLDLWRSGAPSRGRCHRSEGGAAADHARSRHRTLVSTCSSLHNTANDRA